MSSKPNHATRRWSAINSRVVGLRYFSQPSSVSEKIDGRSYRFHSALFWLLLCESFLKGQIANASGAWGHRYRGPVPSLFPILILRRSSLSFQHSVTTICTHTCRHTPRSSFMGLFKGVRGSLLRKANQYRLVIAVYMMRQSASVEIDAGDIAPVSLSIS